MVTASVWNGKTLFSCLNWEKALAYVLSPSQAANPRICPYFKDGLIIAKEYGYDVQFFTNATFLNSDILPICRENEIRLLVSLDGDRRFHDHFRGQIGAFDRTVANAKRFTGEGVKLGVQSTVVPQNVELIPHVAATARWMGACALTFGPVMAQGRAKDRFDLRMVDYELRYALATIARIA